jgi:FKBP-type peptidyl-prolyl cis-trans isomerase FkpA
MMNYKSLFFVLIVIFISCNKDESDQAELDDQIIKDYLAEHNLDATKHASGLYYLITQEGTGVKPNINSKVTLTYKGYFTDGSVFDQSGNNPFTSYLANLIEGWKIGIPLFKNGSHGTLFIPSALGYGENGGGSIPGNTVLIFDIVLIDVE